MNPQRDTDTEAIRSDIDQTRRRMDDTMDALGNRLQGRHLLDEIVGFFRRRESNGDGTITRAREKISQSTSTAVHAVADTIKANPLPALLIGAGVAWMIYESRRDRSSETEDYRAGFASDDLQYDPDLHYDRPLEYPSATTGENWSENQGESKLQHAKDALKQKAASAKETVKEKMSTLGDRTREKAGQLRARAGELGSEVKDRTRQAYAKTRDSVVSTADRHPLEVGLTCLAVGVLAGLLIPTPSPVNRTIGPAADRLRQRTRETGAEMLEKGKRVARAAADAVKHEAEAQGLTPDRLRNEARNIGERAGEAAKDAARREGLTPSRDTASPGAQPGSQGAPTAAATPTGTVPTPPM